jgi:hypothetical protein
MAGCEDGGLGGGKGERRGGNDWIELPFGMEFRTLQNWAILDGSEERVK